MCVSAKLKEVQGHLSYQYCHVNLNFSFCSKCCTLKTLSQTLSVCISVAIKHAFTLAIMPHKDTSVATKQAITWALNVPQGHKLRYRTSYYAGSKCHTGTQALAICQALNGSLP